VWRTQHRSSHVRTFLVAHANNIVSANVNIILSENVKTDVGPMNLCRITASLILTTVKFYAGLQLDVDNNKVEH